MKSLFPETKIIAPPYLSPPRCILNSYFKMDTGNQLLRGEPCKGPTSPPWKSCKTSRCLNILTIQIRDNTTVIFAPPWPMYAFSIIYHKS